MGLTYNFVPLERRLPTSSKRAPFRSTFSKTLDLLESELFKLNARNVVLQADVQRDEIRLDGMLRAGARPRSPGIILSFDSKHGPLSYPCHAFDEWQDNLRAIALGLEALRAVDRYGVTKRAEQYKGWQALPAPNDEAWTKEQAAEWIRVLLELSRDELGRSREIWEQRIRQAEFKTHPDRGGNAVDFHKVQQARKVLLG